MGIGAHAGASANAGISAGISDGESNTNTVGETNSANYKANQGNAGTRILKGIRNAWSGSDSGKGSAGEQKTGTTQSTNSSVAHGSNHNENKGGNAGAGANIGISANISINQTILVCEDSYIVYGNCSVGVNMNDKVTVANLAEFICRVNCGLPYGNFEFNYTDGTVTYKSDIYCKDIEVSDAVVEHSIYVISSMFENYGKGLLNVISGKLSPQDAIPEWKE